MGSMLAEGEVEFIFQKAGSNDTLVLHGELEDVFTLPNGTDGAPTQAPYDGTGALMFVVAVIVVYSLSMFFIVATLLRRKSSKKSLDGQVNQYIKGLEAAREQDKMEQVLRTRLRWPGNFIRFGFESYSASDEVGPRSDSTVGSDNITSSDESFIEMPATTLSLDHPNITSSFDQDKDNAEDDDDDNNLPPVYTIPEFLRRNRRHRTGDSRPTSLCKSNSTDDRPVASVAVVVEDNGMDSDISTDDLVTRPNIMVLNNVVEQYIPLASFDPTPSSSASMNFSDACA